MLRISAVAAVIVTVCLGWSGALVLERFVIGGLDGRLDAELLLLASAVDADGRVDRTRLDTAARTIAGLHGWRWRIAGPDGVLGSATLSVDSEHHGPPRPPPDGPGGPSAPHPWPVDGTDAQGRSVHARALSLPSDRGPVLLLAEAPRSVVRRPILGALTPLLLILAALLVLLVVASVLQLRIGLAPVRRLRDQLAALRSGERDVVDEDQPAELRPLAVELNVLARENKAAIAAARGTAANLAHALKTPIAVLALDLRDDPEKSAQLGRMEATIRHHLRRARIEAADRRVATLLTPALDGVLAVIRQLHAERGLAVDREDEPALLVGIDPQDLDEMLGNLLDNAARHARTKIAVRAFVDRDHPDRVRISIADDGPGIPEAQRHKALGRGLRLDERGGGYGFGLAIVAETIALYGGSLELAERPGGGLVAAMTLPRRSGRI